LWLAHAYWEGKGVAKDEAHAMALYEPACSAEEQSACYMLAVGYLQGRGLTRNEERGRAILRSACAAGHGGSCTYLGNLEEADAARSTRSNAL
jgi:TPR repeat protein